MALCLPQDEVHAMSIARDIFAHLRASDGQGLAAPAVAASMPSTVHVASPSNASDGGVTWQEPLYPAEELRSVQWRYTLQWIIRTTRSAHACRHVCMHAMKPHLPASHQLGVAPSLSRQEAWPSLQPIRDAVPS